MTDESISSVDSNDIGKNCEIKEDDDLNNEEIKKFNAEFKAYLKKENSTQTGIKDKIIIVEDDYTNKEKLSISDDVYNLTIAVNMTKSLPPT